MCGRFTASFEFSQIRTRFNLDRDLPGLKPRFNIAPGQEVPVIINDENGRRKLKMMRWGLVPSWLSERTNGSQLINARAETLVEKPSFKKLIATQRCLVPADGFYEWPANGREKRPVWIYLENREPFAFAGLWDVWRGPESELYTFTIITTEANKRLQKINNRMPVILDQLAAEHWMDPVFTSLQMLELLLRPYPSERVHGHYVSRLVNAPENDAPQCIQPVSS